MNLREALDDVESVCSICEECEPSCANNVFKSCFQDEIENEQMILQFKPFEEPQPLQPIK
jgi:hypothetical protein